MAYAAPLRRFTKFQLGLSHSFKCWTKLHAYSSNRHGTISLPLTWKGKAYSWSALYVRTTVPQGVLNHAIGYLWNIKKDMCGFVFYNFKWRANTDGQGIGPSPTWSAWGSALTLWGRFPRLKCVEKSGDLIKWWGFFVLLLYSWMMNVDVIDPICRVSELEHSSMPVATARKSERFWVRDGLLADEKSWEGLL